MSKHVKMVGAIYLIWGALGLLAVIVLLIIGALGGLMAALGDPEAGVAITLLMSMVVLISAIVSLPNLIAGWGVLKYRQWGRILTIILSILNLFAFPIGTIIGVYSLWVLFNHEVSVMFERGTSMPPVTETGRP